MNYSVKYKANNWLFWRTLKNVKGDGLIEDGKSRFFILDDETRIEVPREYEFEFSKERFFAIKKDMEKTTGQPIVTN